MMTNTITWVKDLQTGNTSSECERFRILLGRTGWVLFDSKTGTEFKMKPGNGYDAAKRLAEKLVGGAA